MTHPHGQSQYQVRFDWGVEGALAIGQDADVIAVVDVLSFSTEVIVAADAGNDVVLTELSSTDGSRICAALTGHPGAVIAAGLRNRRAVAEWTLDRQGDKGDRFVVAVVAAGERRGDGTSRFAVEDLLGAGAIIDALADAGIDYYSPEAAVAAAAYAGLRNATAQLIGASASGREVGDSASDREVGASASGRERQNSGGWSAIGLATALDASSTVPLLGECGFCA